MGGVVKSLSNTLGIGMGAVPEVEKFQESEQLKRLQESANPEEFRTGQADLVKSLQAQLAGEGPSLAREQLKAATDRNLQQQLAAAAAQRSSSPNTARNLLRSQAETGQQAAQQSAQLAAQEQLAAQQQLGGALQQARGQDITSIVQPEQIKAGTFAEELKARTALQEGAQKQQQALAGGVVNAISGGAASLANLLKKTGETTGGTVPAVNSGRFGPTITPGFDSDKRIKKDIKEASSDELKEFLDTLNASKFKYKDSKHGDTEADTFGIMAQDLEKSAIGKTLVSENEEGTKTLDTVKGFGAVLASQAALNKRLEELEKKKR